LIIEKVPILRIKPAAYNPRKDLKKGDPEYEGIRKSIENFTLVEPLVWNRRTGNLVGGHQRLKVLKEQGVTEVEVSVVDLDDKDEKSLNLALNKNMGEWDNLKLRDLLQELQRLDADLDVTGFAEQEIDNLLKSAPEFDPTKEWDGMPEFEMEDKSGRTIIVHFKTDEDVQEFARLMGQSITDKTKYIWFPYQPPEGNADLRYQADEP
jgi:ParB-like chromosome segregation protein Spo0J